MTTTSRNYILSREVVEKKLRRMAYEILEKNMDEKEIILAGIRESGMVVAETIQKMLAAISDIRTEVISIALDKKNPGEIILSRTPDFNNKVVVITDDVANSGKTLSYALKPFLEFHPKKLQTLVLVERSYASFPVRPDFVGISIASTFQEHIFVEVEAGVITGAYLM